MKVRRVRTRSDVSCCELINVVQAAEYRVCDDLSVFPMRRRPSFFWIARCPLSDRSMRPLMVEQQSLRTPTEPSLGSFYIGGIRGPASTSAFTSRSQSRMALSFALAYAAAGLRFRPGCSIDLHVPWCMLQPMLMST